MFEISPQIQLEENEIQFEFVRASGPGGQNVNKVATAAQLRFNIAASTSLNAEIKERLLKLAGTRANSEGILIIEAKQYRTQEQNRADALLRLQELIQKAAVRPKTRHATRPGIAAKAARVFAKKRRGAIKRTRQYNPEEWE
jgi:ribosome-associated protein